MRQIKLLGLVFAAILALAGIALSSTASAITILPTSEKERKFKGKDDDTSKAEPKLVALKNTITCKEASAEGTEEANGKPLGLFHIHFLGCKGEEGGFLAPCNSLGDAKETILTLGTWHLVYDTLKPEKLVATLFLPETLHLECTFIISTLILVLGELLCLDLEAGSKKISHLFHCHQSGALQLETTWWDDKGAGKETKGAELKCKKGTEKEYLHCAELALGLIEHEVELVADF